MAGVINLGLVEGFIAVQRGNPPRDVLIDDVTDRVAYLGFDGFFAATLRALEAGGEGAGFRIDRTPQKWGDTYTERGFYRLDPIAAAARTRALPFTWAEVLAAPNARPLTPEQREVFEEARRHGCADGFVVPSHGGPAAPAILSAFVAGSLPPRSHRHTLHLIAAYFLGSMRTEDQRRDPLKAMLSPREADCLQLTAQGLRAEEAAERLGIRTPTVRYHLNNIKRKYKVKTVVQAVVSALRAEDIEL